MDHLYKLWHYSKYPKICSVRKSGLGLRINEYQTRLAVHMSCV